MKKAGGMSAFSLEIAKVSENLLSMMTKKKITVSPGKVRVGSPGSIIRGINASKELQLGAYVRIIDTMKGAIMIMFPANSALIFADILTNKKIGTTKVLDEIGVSAITEACNILAGSFLNVLGRECKAVLFHSTPRFTSSTTMAATRNIVSDFSGPEMETLIIEAAFSTEGGEMHGSFVLFCEKRVVGMICREAEEFA